MPFFFIFKHSWALNRSWKMFYGVLESPGFFVSKRMVTVHWLSSLMGHMTCSWWLFVSEGICQSYVSRYMKGDIYDMSERSRHAILKWYLIYRKNPAAIGMLSCQDTSWSSLSHWSHWYSLTHVCVEFLLLWVQCFHVFTFINSSFHRNFVKNSFQFCLVRNGKTAVSEQIFWSRLTVEEKLYKKPKWAAFAWFLKYIARKTFVFKMRHENRRFLT